MKSNKFLLQIPVLVLLLSFAACKRSDFDFEDGYTDNSQTPNTSKDIDTNMSVIDRTMYAKARIFPGLVDVSELRVTDSKFTLDLNFTDQNATNLRITYAPQPQFSTGYYAAPGELVKIVVPNNINGLSMQIGGQTDNLTGVSPLLRDPIIYNVKQLYPGINYVRNLYGGTIFINATFSYPNPVEFTISGAVVSPDFILDQMTDAEWVAKVKASKVPWLEMRSKRVSYLVPRDMVIKKMASATEPLTNPTAVMREWNSKFELDYNAWMGLSDDATDIRDKSPQGPWRGVLDIQLPPGAYGHSGTPFVGYMDNEWFNSFTSLKQMLTGTNWGTYHEFGHNCQQPSVWSWSALGETTNNLFSFKVAKRNGVAYNKLHPALSNNMPEALAYAAGTSTTKNFDSDAAINDPFRRMMPFVQIFEIYGYDAMTYLYKAARHAPRLANNDQDRKDFLYERFSEYAQTDLYPFFDAWGISLSTLSKTKIGNLYPALSKQIWTYNIFTKTGGTGNVVFTRSIASISSNQSSEGAPANMLDGNNTTYWHSQYSPAPTAAQTFPFTIVLDNGVRRLVKGMYFFPRNSTAQMVKNVEVFASADNVNFNSVGTTVVPNTFAQHNFTFPTGAVNARYFKIILKDGHNTGQLYAALSEIGTINQ